MGQQVDGILGYDPATATSLMRNMVMFGAFGFPKPPATTQATTKPTTGPTTGPTVGPMTGPMAKPAAAPAKK